jgi:hypothetical protein
LVRADAVGGSRRRGRGADPDVGHILLASSFLATTYPAKGTRAGLVADPHKYRVRVDLDNSLHFADGIS